MGEGGNIVLDFQVPVNPLAGFLRFSTETLCFARKPSIYAAYKVVENSTYTKLTPNTLNFEKRGSDIRPLIGGFFMF